MTAYNLRPILCGFPEIVRKEQETAKRGNLSCCRLLPVRDAFLNVLLSLCLVLREVLAFLRAFSAEAGMFFGRWRQQARLFAALEMLAQRKSVTEVAIAVGYDSVSAFIEMFRTMLGTTPQSYFRGRRSFVATR